MFKKSLFSIVLTGAMMLGSVGASAVEKISSDYNGWNYRASTKTWEYYINGEKPVNGVMQQNDKLYYFNEKGDLRNGWACLNGKWMCFNDSGVRRTGWIKSNNNWYYLNNSGEMQINTIIDGCTINNDGFWVQ